jgi:hypothetical protein
MLFGQIPGAPEFPGRPVTVPVRLEEFTSVKIEEIGLRCHALTYAEYSLPVRYSQQRRRS